MIIQAIQDASVTMFGPLLGSMMRHALQMQTVYTAKQSTSMATFSAVSCSSLEGVKGLRQTEDSDAQEHTVSASTAAFQCTFYPRLFNFKLMDEIGYCNYPHEEAHARCHRLGGVQLQPQGTCHRIQQKQRRRADWETAGISSTWKCKS